MEMEWDPGKDRLNRDKHGIALAEAARLDWTQATTRLDARKDYGEARFQSYAMLDGRLYVCAWALRAGRRRIISLRKANSREVRDHGV